MPDAFGGAHKKGKWLSSRLEERFVAYWTPRLPHSLQTYHLTMLTLLWSAGVVAFGFAAREDTRWLWGISLLIVLQYLTDVFDGAVGRYRGTGLVRWGFYMDHFLDFIFISSIGIAYAFLLPESLFELLFLFVVFGAFMVHGFLAFAATNEFHISFFGIGPTEVRMLFVLANTVAIFLGTTFIERSIPFVATLGTITLIIAVYQAHVRIWRLDRAP